MKKIILPFIIAFAFAVIILTIFRLIPENAITTDFFAGWLSSMVFIFSREHYNK